MLYSNSKVYSIEKGCPWYDLQQYFGPPNVKWCEQTRCALITEPATTWSNFGMILPGLIIWKLSRNCEFKWIRLFGLNLMLMGLLSFFYHATNNLATQFIDFIGMYLYTGTIITINHARLKLNGESHTNFFMLVMGINVLLLSLFIFFDLSYQALILLNIVVVLIQEFLVFKQKPRVETKYGQLWISLIFMAMAQSFSLMDHTRIWCHPTNSVLHGHAIWHILAGISGIFSFMYYRQFDSLLAKKKNY
ncbi:MAG: hypothetical protein EP326_00200 [Deltaproteobacteria bacterium]|nr:MAG: hypothetical protein EP326_00200 [Deltaproteobacteria bacterium]